MVTHFEHTGPSQNLMHSFKVIDSSKIGRGLKTMSHQQLRQICCILFMLGHLQRIAAIADEQHRIVFVKTHKTGSSTLANIMYRFGEERNLRFMLPTDDIRLGWPLKFPGEYAHKPDETNSIYDIVAHHAVLNQATMLKYVPSAKFVTIVRNPVSQFTSAWYFFPQVELNQRLNPSESKQYAKQVTRRSNSKHELSLEKLEVLLPIHANSSEEKLSSIMLSHARFQLYNSQSFTLGWEHFKKKALRLATPDEMVSQKLLVETDRNDGLIRQWLKQLDGVMDTILLVERIDESLVAMARSLNWGASDIERAKLIAYLPVNVRKRPYSKPSKDVVERLEELLHVDQTLYAFATTRLDDQLSALKSRGVDIDKDKKLLLEVSQFLNEKCSPAALTRDEEVDERPRRSLTSLLGRRLESTESQRQVSHRLESTESQRHASHQLESTESQRHASHRTHPKVRQRFKQFRNQNMRNTSLPSKFSPSSSQALTPPAQETRSISGELERFMKSEYNHASAHAVEHLSTLSDAEQASCWRHAADQRSYAQHLKALAGLTCNVRMYKNPVTFNDLPLDIRQMANRCSLPEKKSRPRRPNHQKGD